MIDYKYQTAICKNTNETIGYNETDEHSNEIDFETNYKSTATKVDDIVSGNTTIDIIKTYVQFKNLITGDLTWADVKFTSDDKFYKLYLITDTPL